MWTVCAHFPRCLYDALRIYTHCPRHLYDALRNFACFTPRLYDALRIYAWLFRHLHTALRITFPFPASASIRLIPVVRWPASLWIELSPFSSRCSWLLSFSFLLFWAYVLVFILQGFQLAVSLSFSSLGGGVYFLVFLVQCLYLLLGWCLFCVGALWGVSLCHTPPLFLFLVNCTTSRSLLRP